MKFDVRRMTKEDLRLLAEALFSSGAIGVADRRVLSLDADTRASHWPDWISFETLGEKGGRRDWIDEIEARLAKEHPDPSYVAYLHQTLALLKRVDLARGEVLAVDAVIAEATKQPAPEAAERVLDQAHKQPLSQEF